MAGPLLRLLAGPRTCCAIKRVSKQNRYIIKLWGFALKVLLSRAIG